MVTEAQKRSRKKYHKNRMKNDPIYKKKHMQKSNKWKKKKRIQEKLIVIRYYSNGLMRCNCCYESLIDCLTIDDIQRKYPEHREFSRKHTLYAWLIKNNFPIGFQVLCFNCNIAKGIKPYCPHKNMGC